MKNNSREENISDKERPCVDSPTKNSPFVPDDLVADILTHARLAAIKVGMIEKIALNEFCDQFEKLLRAKLRLAFQDGECLSATKMNILLNAFIAANNKMASIENRVVKLENKDSVTCYKYDSPED